MDRYIGLTHTSSREEPLGVRARGGSSVQMCKPAHPGETSRPSTRPSVARRRGPSRSEPISGVLSHEDRKTNFGSSE